MIEATTGNVEVAVYLTDPVNPDTVRSLTGTLTELPVVENVDFEIGKLNLTPQEIDDLVAFLGRPLTDPRVVRQSAPFDHPQLFVPNGHPVDGGLPRATREGVARDSFLEIPEVGRRGGKLPRGFLE